jgi:hypothetical protein
MPYHRYVPALITFVLLALLLPYPAAAQGPGPVALDKEIIVRTAAGAAADGSFRLEAPGSEVTGLSIAVDDLIHQADPTRRIYGEKVTITPQTASLAAGARQRFILAFSTVGSPGSYSGLVRVRYDSGPAPAGGKPPQGELTIPARLEVIAPAIEVGPGDAPLVIEGLMGTDTFARTLLLTARGGDTTFQCLPGDLAGENGRIIDRSQVSISPQELKLEEDRPKSFTITVGNIVRPGTYRGNLTLATPGQPLAQALVISLTVTARQAPELAALPGSDQVNLSLVSCPATLWGGLNCWLTRLILPGGAFQNSRTLQFANNAYSPARVTGVEVALNSTQALYQVNSQQIGLAQAAGAQATGQGELALPLTVDVSSIPPGEYQGKALVRLEDLKNPLEVPLNLKMRAGCLGPLLGILFGIVLGRLARYMQEKGRPQAGVLFQIHALRGQVKGSITDEGDRAWLEALLAQAEEATSEQQLEEAKGLTAQVEEALKRLWQIQMLETQVAKRWPDPTATGASQARDALEKARQAVHDGKAEEFDQAVAAAQTTLAAPMAKGGPEDTGPLKFELTYAWMLPKKPAIPGEKKKAGWWEKLAAWLDHLSGLARPAQAEFTLWVLVPLFWLILLGGLVLVGLEALYVNKGGTFGATPFQDYLGLVLWGLSSDVAGRTVLSLGGPARQ